MRRDSWCQRHGIQTGADYLRLAFAVMVQDPSRRTPWIFLYSRAQNSGKTTLGVAWRKHMLKGGVVNADRALSNERGFNAELEGNVLALIEETNITKQGRKASYNRLKDWVTADVISIEGKGGNAYEVPNTLHFLQTANDPRNVAFESGDTRITAIELEPMAEEERIDAEELHKRLSEEAPAFLHTLLNLEIPSMGDGRMCPPALTTDLKESQARAAKTAHDLFGERHPEWVGMGDDAFYDAFMAALPEHEERHYWSRSRVLGEIDTLPPKQRELRAVALKLLEVDPGTHSATEWAELIGWDRDPRALGRRLAGLSEVLDGVSGGKSDGARRWTIQHDGGRFAPKRQGGSG
ncbi:MAG: DUF5906 domain-containing protein [Planctomycetota bacterium]